MRTTEETEKVLRGDPRLLDIIVACALNDPDIRALATKLAERRYAGDDMNVVRVALDLAAAINKHIHDHAVASTEISNAMTLLLEPAASSRDH